MENGEEVNLEDDTVSIFKWSKNVHACAKKYRKKSMTQQIKPYDLTKIYYQHYDMYYKILVTFYDNTICVIKEIDFKKPSERETSPNTHL